MSNERKDDVAPDSSSWTEPTLFNLINNVRTGKLTTGTLKPNMWLDYTVREETSQERKFKRLMESCSFKAAMSCVLGMMPQVCF